MENIIYFGQPGVILEVSIAPASAAMIRMNTTPKVFG